MYLTDSYQIKFPKKVSDGVRDDFRVMCDDLSSVYHITDSGVTDIVVSGYSFSLLFDRMASLPGFLNKLKTVAFCVIVQHSFEFDPTYVHVGSYILDYYNLSCEVIDLTDQSPQSLFSALWLVQSYLIGQHCENAVVIYFEQSGCFHSSDFNVQDGVGAMFYSKSL